MFGEPAIVASALAFRSRRATARDSLTGIERVISIAAIPSRHRARARVADEPRGAAKIAAIAILRSKTVWNGNQGDAKSARYHHAT